MSRNPNAEAHRPKYESPDCRARVDNPPPSRFGGFIVENKQGMNRKERRRAVAGFKRYGKKMVKKNKTMDKLKEKGIERKPKEKPKQAARFPLFRKKEKKG